MGEPAGRTEAPVEPDDTRHGARVAIRVGAGVDQAASDAWSRSLGSGAASLLGGLIR